MDRPRAFTLIELLVVVTIIVVLLALLTPALDKAIYQTELTVCGANLKGVGTGVIGYAMDFNRRYPYRAAVMDENTRACQASQLTFPLSSTGRSSVEGYDDRRLIRRHVALKTLNCPLTGKVNLESSPSTTWVFANYAMWWGWQYRPTTGGAGGNLTNVGATISRQAGMFKLGDRLEWSSPAQGTHRFGVLAADHTYNLPTVFGAMESAHPDIETNVLTLEVRQDEADVVYGASQADADATITRSRWWGNGAYGPSGVKDLNYLYDDGSIRRLNRVDHHWDKDKRVVRVPNSPEGPPDASLYQLLPAN